MTWDRDAGQATISKPVPWTRFRTFAVRVRKICFPHMTEPWSLESMLKKLALVKVIPSSQILWVPVVAAVLHSGVRRLVIQPPDPTGPAFSHWRKQHVTFSRVWRDEDASILARYACQFPQLTLLAAPPSVVVELEDVRTVLPNLRALLEISVLRPKTYVHDLRGRWPTRVGTKIETLAVSVPFASASQLLVANRMSSLRILYLDAQILEPQQLDMTEFCRTLATQCPALEELIMNWLEELSLILDPKLPDDGVLPTIRFSPAFRNLSIGHFVDAAGWDASAVARYLAQLVPRYCSLTIPPAPHWRTVWTNLDEIAEGENHLKDAFELVPTYI
ncbi:hypothetical protein B0H13DRAFT_2670196 [Mycena leptocephala]|nr:hypothetical protein B0H13DRAFT_2670196 [Mycena leptocephala]